MAAIWGSVGPALCAQPGRLVNVSALASAPNSAALIIFMSRLLNRDGKSESVAHAIHGRFDPEYGVGCHVFEPRSRFRPRARPAMCVSLTWLRNGHEEREIASQRRAILSREWMLNQRGRREREGEVRPRRGTDEARVSVSGSRPAAD